MTNSETGEGCQKLLASACNLKKNNCEKKAIKNLSPPTTEDERKKDI